jgi:hypothetical protein
MEKLLTFLDGKKSVILAIIAAILSYMVASNVISASLGALFQTIISLLAGGAVYATNDLNGANKLGFKK